ncbi:DUF6397 family protein [Streptomyces sp. NPDC047315]|uniref:DUF6397 family protein n=1 Tax=Streptomyces sp. NPDC047315 TaxID=3155142 RepID=UPI0033C9647A
MAGQEALRTQGTSGVAAAQDVAALGAADSTAAVTPGASGAPAGRERMTGGVTPGRAAKALELQRGELQLAVELGHIRTKGGDAGAPLRIASEEVDRWRQREGFPDVLRRRLRTVGTQSGAELLSISPERFTRLARTGHLAPVRFYLNRYRAVVWLYLAEEVEDFGRDHPELLSGRMPPGLRALADGGEDLRPRAWRSKRMGLYLRATSDPWQRAAGIASLLDPLSVADVVPDPYERSHLGVLRPDLVLLRPASAPAHELVQRILSADDPDEIEWYRVCLMQELSAARQVRSAPRPTRDTPAVAAAGGAPEIAWGDTAVDTPLPAPHVGGPASADETAAHRGRPVEKRTSSRGRSLWRRLRMRQVKALV